MLGLMLGAVVGYGAGILLAPAPGEDTRRRIWERTESMASQAEEKGEELMRQARSSSEELAEKFQEGAREAISGVREQVSAGVSLEDALSELEHKLETNSS